jgi:hypothetical protein
MASRFELGGFTGQNICSSCSNITLEKLCSGFVLPEYSTVQTSALRCKLCELITFSVSDKKNYPWVETALRPDSKLRLVAIRELPFGLPTDDERPHMRERRGRRITKIGILVESREFGVLSVSAPRGNYMDDNLLSFGG